MFDMKWQIVSSNNLVIHIQLIQDHAAKVLVVSSPFPGVAGRAQAHGTPTFSSEPTNPLFLGLFGRDISEVVHSNLRLRLPLGIGLFRWSDGREAPEGRHARDPAGTASPLDLDDLRHMLPDVGNVGLDKGAEKFDSAIEFDNMRHVSGRDALISDNFEITFEVILLAGIVFVVIALLSAFLCGNREVTRA